jgi:hypothetical protein
MQFTFEEGTESASITISKGKNGGFTTSLTGKSLGAKLSDMSNPFCVYVPGIAGIPTQEKYEVAIAVKKSAARGDSNNYLRNILHNISKDVAKWQSFLSSVKSVYGELDILVDFNEDVSEFITVTVKVNGVEVPLDTIGTGLLQVIQIFAYIEYFSPKIILLDEPDAHIHPTKQRDLAAELASRATKDPNLKIVFSTHSRYILESLEDDACVTHFEGGNALGNVKNSSILIDIGAADADYLFGKKKLRYIIATEDKVEGISEKKEFLKNFVVSNGLDEDEFVLHSYEGCTKVHFALILENFVKKHIPGARVIVHIDRDQKIDDDPDLCKLREDCRRQNIALFITKHQEIESYFSTPEHISAIYGIDLDEVKKKYFEWIDELECKTKTTLQNFILRDRPKLGYNKSGKTDIRVVEAQAEEWIKEYKVILTPGKELLGKAKKYLQDSKRDPNLILGRSSGLVSREFQHIIEVISEADGFVQPFEAIEY